MKKQLLPMLCVIIALILLALAMLSCKKSGITNDDVKSNYFNIAKHILGSTYKTIS